ncbi:hypothetical protein [Chryseobacterium sp.]|uniref:hypothetical protein n=1 Tax=Chryseobacterium sp. TaxID=1871047 RepID=UPI002355320A|nr:hypothetical protein [Chryseobacterium sp.]
MQIYEPDYLMIAQDGNLGFFIKSGTEIIYSNDLGALGSLDMKTEALNIEMFLNKSDIGDL